jgi:branched-chain amino acid transport system substrate-binding protein
MTKKLKLVFFVLLLSLFLPTSGCTKKSSSDQASNQTENNSKKNTSPLKIGISLSLNGSVASSGTLQKKGYEMWAEDVNSKDGILGRKVELDIKDDKSSKDEVSKCYEDLINTDKCDLVFLPYSSDLTLAAAAVVEKYGYPSLAGGGSADSIWENGYKNIFGVYAPASNYSATFLELISKKGFKNIALFSSDDSFAKSVFNGTKKWAERYGINISVTDQFKKDLADLKSQAQKAKDANVDAVIMGGNYNESANFRKALKTINWYPKAYFATVGPSMDKFKTELKEDSENVFTSVQWEATSTLSLPGSKEFLDKYQKKYNDLPSYNAATAYASGVILQKAIEKCSSFDRNSIRQALHELDTITLIGRYGVDESGKQQKHNPFVVQWIGGTRKVVWPEDWKEIDALFK